MAEVDDLVSKTRPQNVYDLEWGGAGRFALRYPNRSCNAEFVVPVFQQLLSKVRCLVRSFKVFSTLQHTVMLKLHDALVSVSCRTLGSKPSSHIRVPSSAASEKVMTWSISPLSCFHSHLIAI